MKFNDIPSAEEARTTVSRELANQHKYRVETLRQRVGDEIGKAIASNVCRTTVYTNAGDWRNNEEAADALNEIAGVLKAKGFGALVTLNANMLSAGGRGNPSHTILITWEHS